MLRLVVLRLFVFLLCTTGVLSVKARRSKGHTPTNKPPVAKRTSSWTPPVSPQHRLEPPPSTASGFDLQQKEIDSDLLIPGLGNNPPSWNGQDSGQVEYLAVCLGTNYGNCANDARKSTQIQVPTPSKNAGALDTSNDVSSSLQDSLFDDDEFKDYIVENGLHEHNRKKLELKAVRKPASVSTEETEEQIRLKEYYAAVDAQEAEWKQTRERYPMSVSNSEIRRWMPEKEPNPMGFPSDGANDRAYFRDIYGPNHPFNSLQPKYR